MVALYVHWPFCLSKCPYCDFNSHVRPTVDQDRWRRALVRETQTALAAYRADHPDARVESVFFGGGTPSLMAPRTVAALIDAVHRHWRVAGDVEITLEANPGSSERARFAAYGTAGVNRLSLGVQALDDDALRALGRRHDRRQALAALACARDHFPRLSFDLIYARPGQTAASWRAELEAATALAGDHLSLYQLTIEPGTAFHALWRRGALALPEEDTGAALYEATQEVLEAAGLPAYEVSNHARPGAECRHNLTYWRGGDYVGIGPGAHGRLGGDGGSPRGPKTAWGPGGGTVASRQRRAPEAWLAAVEAHGHGTRERVRLTPAERRDEILMMGLRLAEGVVRERFRRLAGTDIERAVSPDALARLVAGGFLELDGDGLRTTAAGRRRLDAVLTALLA